MPVLRLGALVEVGAVPADAGSGTDSRWASTSRRPVRSSPSCASVNLTSCSPTRRTPPYNRDHNQAQATTLLTRRIAQAQATTLLTRRIAQAQATTPLTRRIAQAHGHHRAPGRSSPPRGSSSSRASHRSARFTPDLLPDITPVSDVETKTTGCTTAQDHMVRPS
ncbi:hypothetical protein [Streptomyces canus]|uniref:hypothetical protein n=1 Tax=Streptomyces canus TaxID=58343 RepID=UPI00278A5D3E|nr:hypothetical protein [Streptomyces canus]MDQ0761521.1 hypothetical protein [Streptomyces canus]